MGETVVITSRWCWSRKLVELSRASSTGFFKRLWTPTGVPQTGDGRLHMQSQRTRAVIARKLSKKELYNYFFPRRNPIWVWIAFAGSATSLIISMFMHSMTFIGIAVFLGLIGVFRIWRTKRLNPNDEQYDAWVRRQGKILYTRGLEVLGITEAELSSHALWMQSFVLPGSRDADDYEAEVVWLKEGKDGRSRSSINVYTFFYPMARSFAIFKSDVNAFYPSQHNDLDEIYAYHHLVSATTKRIRDNIFVGEQEFPYLIEQFCLKITNGDTLQLSAAVKARPFGSVPGIPTITLPDTDFIWTLGQLRSMLLSKP
jgi:hypothetical protein